MNVVVVETPGLGDRSYVVHDGQHALVIDPQRDIDRFDAILAEQGVSLTHVLETHIHNDYVSGGLLLARRHGAQYVLPAGVDLAFDGRQVADGDTLTVAGLTVTALHTPGHTPHHLSYAIADTSESSGAPAVFTGGSMLYGAVGRPDLIGPEETLGLAHSQWHSVQRLASELDDGASVFPTHGFGSFCAATQNEGKRGTIADERKSNPALLQTETEFVDDMLRALDVFPAYYVHMGTTNAAGPEPVDLSLPALAEAAAIRSRLDAGEWVIDLRHRAAFATGHLAGSYSFDLDGPFIAYLSWMIPWNTPVTLLGDSIDQVHEAQREMIRVGINRPAAHNADGLNAWLRNSSDAVSTRRIDFRALRDQIEVDPATLLMDARQLNEWHAGHLSGATHMPFYDVLTRSNELPLDVPIYIYCGTGYRAAVVASILQDRGHLVVHVDDDWENAAATGLPVEVLPAPQRDPGWTWRASRASVRTFESTAGRR